MSENGSSVSRRGFLGALGAAGIAGALAPAGRAQGKGAEETAFLDKAPEGRPLKAGLIGCGGRGTGAAHNFLSSGPGLSITALGDVFQDRVDGCRASLEERGQEIPGERCFTGFDAWKRVIESDVDVVLMATPPHFRPDHFAACVAAGKHVFMEKPVAVDPVGARLVIDAGRKAAAQGLCVVTGTQRRHQRDYCATYQRINSGAIGEIVAANCYWNQGQLWYRTREQGWSDMEWMIRDWVNWTWLSGDHIVEQHVHNLDVINWFTGMHPVSAVGFGARQRRVTGDQYDMFSVDFVYPNGMHLHSMCRQINGCANNVSETIQGTAGSTNCCNRIHGPGGEVAWSFDYGRDSRGRPRNSVAVSPYDQEHIDLVAAIRTGQPINEAENTAVSTLAAVMGRISAYTGREVTWDEMMASDLRLGPAEYALGPAEIAPVIAVPGE